MCVLLTPSLLRKLRYWTILEEDEVETSDNTSTCIVLVSRSPLLMMGSCCFLSMRVFFSGIVYTAGIIDGQNDNFQGYPRTFLSSRH